MKFINKYHRVILCFIPLLSFALHYHIFNLDLVGIHVWRQTETQTVINNFYHDDFNIFNAKINNFVWRNRDFRLEFPTLQWIYAIFYKIFGEHIAISRVLTFILGLFSVYGMYYLCKAVFKNIQIATICAWCFNFSPVFYYYTVNPLPDNLSLCCGIWSIAFFYNYINTEKTKYLIWSAIFLSLATLIKLPLILYGSLMLTFFILQLKWKERSLKQLLFPVAVFILCALPDLAWYMYVIPNYWYGMLVLKGVAGVKLTMADTFSFLWGNATSVLPELLINYGSVLFFILGFYFIIRNKTYKNKYFPLFAVWGLSILVYFLFELNVICLVHDYYLLPFLPVIFLLVAYGGYSLLSSKRKYLQILAGTCLVILPLTAFLRADSRWNTKEPNFNVSYYNNKKEIRDLIPKDAYVIAGNDASQQISLYYIDRKGWTYEDDILNDKIISDYMNKGARYLFIDGNADTISEVKAHLAEKIFDKETLRIYKLK